LHGGAVGEGDGAAGRIGDAGDASVEIVSIGGGFGDAIGAAAFGDDAAARVISPRLPTSGVAHGGAPADGELSFQDSGQVHEPDVRPCGTNIGHPEQKPIQNPGETTATRQRK